MTKIYDTTLMPHIDTARSNCYALSAPTAKILYSTYRVLRTGMLLKFRTKELLTK